MNADRGRIENVTSVIWVVFAAMTFALIYWVLQDGSIVDFAAPFLAFIAVGLFSGFVLHLWAQRYSKHQVQVDEAVQELSGRELAKLAAPTLALPIDTDAMLARVLSSGKIDRSATQAFVADAAARGVVHIEQPKRIVQFGPGSHMHQMQNSDRARLSTLLATGQGAIALGRRTKPLIHASSAVTDSCAAEVVATGLWTFGNPGGRDMQRVSRSVWGVAWALMLIGLFVCFTGSAGYLVGAAVMMAGFGIGVGYWGRSRAELPALSTDGARRVTELESLRLGLRRVTDDQIQVMHQNGQLATYAAWAVILGAPRFVRLINKLSRKRTDDQAIQQARAIVSLSLPPATYALGVQDPLQASIFIAALPISIAIWVRRYKIGNRPLAASPVQTEPYR